MRTACDTARELLRAGICPVPVAARSKRPRIKGWQALTCEAVSADFEKLFPSGATQNVGVLLGAASGGLIDIDLDWPEARNVAAHFLPRTATFGRRSNPISHYAYVCTPIPATKQLCPPTAVDPHKKPHIVEVRSDRCQTVWPGSIHESGEEVRWDVAAETTPAQISEAELTRAVHRVVAAAYLSSIWGKGHSRDELSTALAGGLIAIGWSVEAVRHFIKAIAESVGDEEISQRLKKAGRAARIIGGRTDGAQPGWPTMSKLLGVAVCEWLRNLLAEASSALPSSDELIAELNSRHAVVMVSGQFRVITEHLLPQGKRTVSYSSKSDFCHQYEARWVQVGRKRVSIASIWLANPLRRQYDRIVFAPQPPGSEPKEVDGAYNLWRGLAVEPADGDCSLFLKHVEDIVCSDNAELYTYVLNWLADAVQNVGGMRPGVALVLRGAEGVGKGAFVKHFGSIFGQHFRHVSRTSHLVGNFNAHLQDTVLLFADEAYWAGNKADEGALKGLITEETLMIEPKGVNAFEIENHIRFIFATNNDWAVPAGYDARRFCVLDVSDRRKQDSAYFARLEAQMRAGGTAALLRHLVNVDLSQVDLRKVPVTQALLDQKRRTMDPIDAWFYDCVRNGTIEGTDENWPSQPIPKGDLHALFVEYAKRLGLRYIPDLATFCQRFHKLVPKIDEVRTTIRGKRTRAYVLPNLEACRKHWDKLLGAPSDWPEGSAAVRTSEI